MAGHSRPATTTTEDMRAAAFVLDRIGSPLWGALLINVAQAAEDSKSGPASTVEHMRWTPVVVRAERLAELILDAVASDPLAAPMLTSDVR